MGEPAVSAYDAVRAYWRGQKPPGDFEHFWESTLEGGVVADSAFAPVQVTLNAPAIAQGVQAAAQTAPAASLGDIRKQPSANATQALGGKGVLVVGTEAVKADNVLDMVSAPTALSSGDRVILITDEHSNVVGYKRAPAPLSNVEVQSALAERDQQISKIQSQLTETQTAHAAELRQRDQQIAQLQTELGKLQVAHELIATRDEQIAKLGTRLTELDQLVRSRPNR